MFHSLAGHMLIEAKTETTSVRGDVGERLIGIDLTLPHQEGGLVRVAPRRKFLYAGDEKFYVRGVTYGGFRPRRNGEEFPEPAAVEIDLLRKKSAGINAMRTYTVPPRWLLDA